ncbi:2-amino-4-hydroxy-6-hydroxymethyldihydropteridine pyrophosphokinase [Gordonia araii NBRC 100433]|uniref:2-amino-4-hydroxy-6-hydroxymethyldihydropteridine diphosphokinase n=1 Tax=Gordonia araii NBRC 100433 TaxID=1073574 RepID=G7H2W3_9ACTN|nr:2-amino-4-hydroxy-6-hydroxymethyldihydropteridine diphosphokinase [Gordonia araii]NNG98328.1 2-amino-4-hydroxy-6-hydroxymethyldihydropteridine diphosphokinase [Gordonia araii NBRC 100433]GAB10188.1 2-amino-4-hydroxy-6-hydroxymethyldihydropteridine pyrophosphokinase [Gordonia araii NBRC 100433]
MTGSVAVLSAGSNIGDRLAHLAGVIDGFVSAGDEIRAVSPVYATPPWGGVEQDDFYNITLIVAGDRDALSWLRRGAELETAADRRRDIRWGPRTLDVDVIAVRDTAGHPVFSATDELTLPHPRAHERGFVLIPWLAVDPDARLDLPDGGSVPVADLVAGLDPDERAAISRLDVALPVSRSIRTDAGEKR